jgi:2,6-dihydroxypyridine 3-monooxygenase
MNNYSTASAIVAGESIGGLTAALLLRDLGFSVDVYERTPTPLEGSGSGIVLQPQSAIRALRAGPTDTVAERKNQ